MPQGSDYYQRQKRQELSERCTMQNVCKELDELRGRVRFLEELVWKMAKRLNIETGNKWHYWK